MRQETVTNKWERSNPIIVDWKEVLNVWLWHCALSDMVLCKWGITNLLPLQPMGSPETGMKGLVKHIFSFSFFHLYCSMISK